MNFFSSPAAPSHTAPYFQTLPLALSPRAGPQLDLVTHTTFPRYCGSKPEPLLEKIPQFREIAYEVHGVQVLDCHSLIDANPEDVARKDGDSGGKPLGYPVVLRHGPLAVRRGGAPVVRVVFTFAGRLAGAEGAEALEEERPARAEGATHRDGGAADYLVDTGVAGAEGGGGAIHLEGVVVVRCGVVLGGGGGGLAPGRRQRAPERVEEGGCGGLSPGKGRGGGSRPGGAATMRGAGAVSVSGQPVNVPVRIAHATYLPGSVQRQHLDVARVHVAVPRSAQGDRLHLHEDAADKIEDDWGRPEHVGAEVGGGRHWREVT
mmetsp:Transcript_24584/g.48870  ORF Transcript_24584/g.48870 Transcript_24584/m.48870 type:complete len:319 (-) Transcript_24584:725-1681(-)